MSDAYYRPGDEWDRFQEDIADIAEGRAPEWWDEGFRDLVDSGSQTRTWFDFAQGYEFAAQNLVELLGNHPSARWRIELTPPVVFLYRHAVELLIKNAYLSLGLGDGSVPGTHDFVTLWRELRDKLVDGFADPEREMALLDKAIVVIDNLDPTSFSFRYPVDRGGALTPNVPPLDPAALGRVATRLADAITVALSRVQELAAGRDWRQL